MLRVSLVLNFSLLLLAAILKASSDASDIESATIESVSIVAPDVWPIPPPNVPPQYIVIWRPPPGNLRDEIFQVMVENPSGCSLVIICIACVILGILLLMGACPN